MITLKTGRRDGTAVQVVFALMLAVIVGAALWWGFLRENAPMGAQGIRVQADFTAMPDGPAPDHFDGGQPASVLVSPDEGGDQLRIQHGRLSYQPTTQGTAAAFFSSPDLGSSVEGMGARFVFRPGSGYAWRNRAYGVARHQERPSTNNRVGVDSLRGDTDQLVHQRRAGLTTHHRTWSRPIVFRNHCAKTDKLSTRHT